MLKQETIIGMTVGQIIALLSLFFTIMMGGIIMSNKINRSQTELEIKIAMVQAMTNRNAIDIIDLRSEQEKRRLETKADIEKVVQTINQTKEEIIKNIRLYK